MVRIYEKGMRTSSNTRGTLLERGAQSIVGRSILKISFRVGTTGTSGTGFIGFLLSAMPEKSLSEEWMTLTIWGAGENCLLDGEWVEANKRFYETKKPLYSESMQKELRWDHFTPKITGAIIVRVNLQTDSLSLELHNQGTEYIFQVLDEDKRLPPAHTGGSYNVILRPGEQLGNFIVFHDLDTVLHV